MFTDTSIDSLPPLLVKYGQSLLRRYLPHRFLIIGILQHSGLTGAEILNDSDLVHYGRKGQKWGVRNGPPYPLRGDGLSAYKKSEDESTGLDLPKITKKVEKKKYRWDEYEIEGPDKSGEKFSLVKGTKMRNPEVFAGKGTKSPLKEETKNGLAKEFKGTDPENWQHSKGFGDVDYYGDFRPAEIHWFQEEEAGKHKFKIKKWLDD